MEPGQLIACGILTTGAMYYAYFYGHTTVFNMLSCVVCIIAMVAVHKK